MLKYGNAVSNVKIADLVSFHKQNGKLGTLTGIQLPSQFGTMEIGQDAAVSHFREKANDKNVWINGGFFVLEPGIFKFLDGNMEDVQWEKGPLLQISQQNQLIAFRHYGFWKSMDALRDKIELEKLWSDGGAPWKIWK